VLAVDGARLLVAGDPGSRSTTSAAGGDGPSGGSGTSDRGARARPVGGDGRRLPVPGELDQSGALLQALGAGCPGGRLRRRRPRRGRAPVRSGTRRGRRGRRRPRRRAPRAARRRARSRRHATARAAPRRAHVDAAAAAHLASTRSSCEARRAARSTSLVERAAQLFAEDDASCCRRPTTPSRTGSARTREPRRAYGDYQLVVDAIADRLLDLREAYAATLARRHRRRVPRRSRRAPPRRFRRYASLVADSEDSARARAELGGAARPQRARELQVRPRLVVRPWLRSAGRGRSARSRRRARARAPCGTRPRPPSQRLIRKYAIRAPRGSTPSRARDASPSRAPRWPARHAAPQVAPPCWKRSYAALISAADRQRVEASGARDARTGSRRLSSAAAARTRRELPRARRGRRSRARTAGRTAPPRALVRARRQACQDAFGALPQLAAALRRARIVGDPGRRARRRAPRAPPPRAAAGHRGRSRSSDAPLRPDDAAAAHVGSHDEQRCHHGKLVPDVGRTTLPAGVRPSGRCLASKSRKRPVPSARRRPRSPTRACRPPRASRGRASGRTRASRTPRTTPRPRRALVVGHRPDARLPRPAVKPTATRDGIPSIRSITPSRPRSAGSSRPA
jgi:hypothetical protein